MTDYTVEWSIFIEDTDSPKAAAEVAWETMRNPDSFANVFEVSDSMDMSTSVDLHEDRVGDPVWMPGPRNVADLAEWMNDNDWDFSEIVEMIRRPHKYAREFSAMVIEREFAKVAKEPEAPEATPENTQSDLAVSFTPEKWVNDYAVEVAVRDTPFEWFVSDETKELVAEALKSGSDLDFVREDFFTPGWIAEWDGPFTIEALADRHPYVNNPEVMRCKWCDLASSVHANDDVFV